MNLIQILLPLDDGHKRRFNRLQYVGIEQQLISCFGGSTAYPRAPATGLWQRDGASPVRDELFIYEGMIETFARGWWESFRRKLEEDFELEKILIRSPEIETR